MSEQRQHDLNTRDGCFEAFLEQKRRADERAEQVVRYDMAIATLTAERDSLAATLRQGAESDTDLRKRYEALERENVALKEQVARLSAPVTGEEIIANFRPLPDNAQVGDWCATFAAIIASRTAPEKESEAS